MDIEDSQIVDFANTCKIRVIDNDETYAIDEVSFAKSRLPPANYLVLLFFLQLGQASFESASRPHRRRTYWPKAVRCTFWGLAISRSSSWGQQVDGTGQRA